MIKIGPGVISKTSALLLMRAFAHELKYQDSEWETGEVAGAHPFLDKQPAVWCGSPGVTDSIGVWFNVIVRELLASYGDEGLEFRMWYTTVNPTQHDYIMDMKINDIHYLVSGINNYSGTGGAGGKLAKEFVDALNDLLEDQLKRRGITNIERLQFSAALRAHSTAIMEERKYQETEYER